MGMDSGLQRHGGVYVLDQRLLRTSEEFHHSRGRVLLVPAPSLVERRRRLARPRLRYRQFRWVTSFFFHVLLCLAFTQNSHTKLNIKLNSLYWEFYLWFFRSTEKIFEMEALRTPESAHLLRVPRQRPRRTAQRVDR